jgi:hypothetical protein
MNLALARQGLRNEMKVNHISVEDVLQAELFVMN